MIKIHKPFIKENSSTVRVYCKIDVDNITKTVWFEVDKEYGKYLVTDRVDAYVIGLLHWAMKNKHDIRCEVALTDELLYNITTILIPTLSKHVSYLHNISITAEVKPPISGVGVGTGCSCGIDSFDAIYMHLNTKYKNMDLTHLCINNVGAFNECYEEYGIEEVKKERYKVVDDVAKTLGLPIIKTNSNFADIFQQVHLYTHTYSSVFAIYMLQKLWKIYYYASSGIDYSYFSLTDYECAHYELLSLQCFSTSGLKIYSEGGEKTRIEKTRDILNFEVAKKYLHVCIKKPYNCGVCSKCRRTLLTLEALESLKEFNNVFDIEYYMNNKKEYYHWFYEQIKYGDSMMNEVYELLMKKKEFRRECKKYAPVYWIKRLNNKIRAVLGKGAVE